MFEKLTDKNFTLYAAKYYENMSCMDEDEFNEDLNRVKYIKRLIKKYERDGEVNERLLLNHLIILYNVFPPEVCTRILCFKLEEHLEVLKPFLIYLNYWPDKIKTFGEHTKPLIGSDIKMDAKIVKILREI